MAGEAVPWGGQSSGCVAGPPGLTSACPSPADDRPGLDPAGWLLLPRPVEHPGLCGGGRSVGGLRFGVSNSFLFQAPPPLLPEKQLARSGVKECFPGNVPPIRPSRAPYNFHSHALHGGTGEEEMRWH